MIKGKRKRDKKFTSPVWIAFELLPKIILDGFKKAKCKFCWEIKKYFGQYGIVAMIMHNLPLSFVEYSGVKDLFTYLCDDATSIFRNTARSDILKLHKREKTKLKYLLKETHRRICLTSDLWTSIITDGFIYLTAHSVDKDWKLWKRILNFSYMPPPHNDVSLSEKIYALLADWEIDNKLFSITLDNASANDTSVDFLKLQLNVRKALIKGGEFFSYKMLCSYSELNSSRWFEEDR
ncbi:hypothetical protein PTKIN_Ptkin05aG0133100 [Pterospermum kingtungense]